MKDDNFTKELKKQGFKEYKHTSGAIAWSIENLAEYSDNWKSL